MAKTLTKNIYTVIIYDFDHEELDRASFDSEPFCRTWVEIFAVSHCLSFFSAKILDPHQQVIAYTDSYGYWIKEVASEEELSMEGNDTWGAYEFFWDVGRMGFVSSFFAAKKADVENLIGKEVYLGEALGKHSEIAGTVDEGDLKLISDDQEFVAKIIESFGYDPNDGSTHYTFVGYNPLHYYEESLL